VTQRFMLDTDTVSFALRGQGRVGAEILKRLPSELCVSAITVAELRYGATRRGSAKLHNLIDTFTGNVGVMPFDDSCAAHFGSVAAELASRGAPIGEFDVLIAAHAIALSATLVTNNVKHFERVRGLHVENWF
jgi:tRNA(fMet)-specific endonuclease VapC